MLYEFRKITIISSRKPIKKDINQDLQWFSNSLGLFTERDKEKSCFRIFIELIKAAKNRISLTSDQLAQRTHLSRATIIHHLNKLIEAGIVINQDNKYILKVDNLEQLIDEVKLDLNKVLHELKLMAEELDEQLGLIRR